MQRSLLCVGGMNHGRVVPIVVNEFRIGRDAMCHLRPASTDISRLHCAIVLHADGRVFVRDYASSNGTVVNQRMLIGGEYEIKDGDVFEVGPLVFRFHEQVDASTTVGAAAIMTTQNAPQAPKPGVVPPPVPPLPPRPILPGLTTVSSVPRFAYRDESALETTPDLLTDSHIFSVGNNDDCLHHNDTLPHSTFGSRRSSDAGPMLVQD
jgi:pSer/pThr/pTyr-binding forkhead associated (FHA) protein